MDRENRRNNFALPVHSPRKLRVETVRDNRYRLLLGCDGPMSRLGYGTSDPLVYKKTEGIM